MSCTVLLEKILEKKEDVQAPVAAPARRFQLVTTRFVITTIDGLGASQASERAAVWICWKGSILGCHSGFHRE